MALSVEKQLQYWGAGVLAVLVLFYFLGSALTPFIVGAGLAYCLDPLADRLEAMGASRVLATALIMIGAFLMFLAAVLILRPFLVDQAVRLVDAVPGVVDQLWTLLTRYFPSYFEQNAGMPDTLANLQQRLNESGVSLLNSVLASTLAVFDFLLLLVIAPVVAFYLLLDWDHMVARIDSYLPLDHKATVRRLASQIDTVLASFMRGQITVMAFLGTFYALGLMLVGLEFGVIVGIIAGLISFIPYIGSIIGGGLAISLALTQFWGEWPSIAAVIAVFAAGQFIEGNILTPKLLGSSVGLHPVWLMFALSAFGSLFGFAGLLIAVPVAACLGVLARFAMEQYMLGRLYRGLAGNDLDNDLTE